MSILLRRAAVFCCVWAVVCAVQAEEPQTGVLVPYSSAASAEGPLASVWNPAALALRRNGSAAYLRGLQGIGSRDDAFYLSGRGFGAALELYSAHDADGNPVNVRKTVAASGGRIVGDFYWGAARSGYSSKDPDYDKLAVWDAALLLRRRWTAFSVSANALNQPVFRGVETPRRWVVSAAVRPFTDRATFSFEMHKRSDESFKTAWERNRYVGGIEMEPIEGLRLAAHAHGGGEFDARAVFSLGYAGVGYHQRLLDGKADGGVGTIVIDRSRFSGMFQKRRRVVAASPAQWKRAYWRIRLDEQTAAVVLKLNGERMSPADWQEMRAQLNEIQRQGKTVAAYIQETGTGGYWAVSGADLILIDPLGELRLTGLLAQSRYYKAALDKLKIDAQFVHAGAYKSGHEPYSRTEPSRNAAENVDATLDDLFEQMTADIGAARAWTPEKTAEKIDNAPYFGEEAASAGLAHGAASPREAEARLRKRFPRAVWTDASAYLNEPQTRRAWVEPRDKIAAIQLRGTMVDGESMVNPFTNARFSGSASINRAIRAAAADPDVKAIVVDIDSGGGLVTASESIWRALSEARQHKPVVARIGGIGASGAYHAASAADAVVALPASVTGSIGVYSGRVSARAFLENLGINVHLEKRGENADLFSLMADPSERWSATAQRQVDQMYDHFIRRVSEGRGMSVEEAAAAADGRVWTGRQAKEVGLVDELGGMLEAVEKAKALAGIPSGRRVKIETLPKPTWLQRLLNAALEKAGGFPDAQTLMRRRALAWEPLEIQF